MNVILKCLLFLSLTVNAIATEVSDHDMQDDNSPTLSADYEYYTYKFPELIELFKKFGITNENISMIEYSDSTNKLQVAYIKEKICIQTFKQNADTGKYDEENSSEVIEQIGPEVEYEYLMQNPKLLEALEKLKLTKKHLKTVLYSTRYRIHNDKTLFINKDSDNKK